MSYVDLTIIAVYLLFILLVGLNTRKYVEDFSSFMVAKRNVGLSLGVVTMLGTELGLITVMYNAQAGVTGFFASFHIGLAAFVVTFLIGITGFVIVELRKLNVKSIPEYYNLRFGKNVRIIGALLLCLGGILNMGLFLKIGAIFIQSIFGFDDKSITIIMAFLLVLVLVYTMSGGMITVIITDYIQYLVLSLGLLLSVFFSVKYFGCSNIFTLLENLEIDNRMFSYDDIYNPIKNKGFSYISWQVVLGFVSAVIWPTAITRALSVKNVNLVKKQYIWSSISFLIRFIIPSFLGICAFIYFSINTDVLVHKTNLSLMPLYLSEVLPVGVLGIVVAGMLAAFMSTHDSYLLCWSTIITNDIVEPFLGKKISSQRKIFITRLCILLLGFYIFVWGMFYEGSDAIWDYLGITGAIYFTGAISVVVLGVYWKKASSTGAILSLLGGFSAIIGLEPIRNAIGIKLSNPSVIGLSSLMFTVILMILGSLLFPDIDKGAQKT